MKDFILIITSLVFFTEAYCIDLRYQPQTSVIFMFSLRKASNDEAKSLWDLRTSAIRNIDKQYYLQEDLEKWAPIKMPEDFLEAVINNEWYVIEIDDAIVACGLLDAKNCTLEAIFVRPQFQGQGLAKKMLEHLEASAKKYGIEQLYLSATLNAEGFYKKYGYKLIEKSTWISPRGVNLACIRMVKKLI